MIGFGVFRIQKEVKSMQKQPSCIKMVWPPKPLMKKRCEIKDGSHELAVMMLNFNNGFVHY